MALSDRLLYLDDQNSSNQSRGCSCLAKARPSPVWLLNADRKASSSGTRKSVTGLGCQVSHRVPRLHRSQTESRPLSTSDADASGGVEARRSNKSRGWRREPGWRASGCGHKKLNPNMGVLIQTCFSSVAENGRTWHIPKLCLRCETLG